MQYIGVVSLAVKPWKIPLNVVFRRVLSKTFNRYGKAAYKDLNVAEVLFGEHVMITVKILTAVPTISLLP